MKSLKNIIFAFVLAVSLCVVFVLAKINLKGFLVDEEQGFAKIVNAKNVENIFIGSSMFKKGLDMEILNKSEPLENTFLLSYNGNQPFQIEQEITALLKNGVSIKRIFIDMYAYSAIANPSLRDKRLYLDLDYSSAKNIFDKLYKDLSVLERAKQFYTLFVRLNNEHFLCYPVLLYTNSTEAKNATDKVINNGKSKEELDALGIPPVRKNATMNEGQKQSILNIKELAKSNNIELFFLETPKYITIPTDKHYIAIMQEYKNFLDANGIAYILFEDKDFCANPDCFVDLLHMSTSGKENFSNMVLEKIEGF